MKLSSTGLDKGFSRSWPLKGNDSNYHKFKQRSRQTSTNSTIFMGYTESSEKCLVDSCTLLAWNSITPMSPNRHHIGSWQTPWHLISWVAEVFSWVVLGIAGTLWRRLWASWTGLYLTMYMWLTLDRLTTHWVYWALNTYGLDWAVWA